MAVALGSEIYIADVQPVMARGYKFTEEALEAARTNEIPALLTDEDGQQQLEEFCASLNLTGFASDVLQETLEPIEEEEHSYGWREGEALAEAWLTEHKQCEFPWPFKRDLRHHRASLPGAEMVGIAGSDPADCVLAFGQVKTSKHALNPPTVVNNGPKSLLNQIRELQGNDSIKKTLVQYLAHRASGLTTESWVNKFRTALIQYCESGKLRMAVFGVLIRDVAANSLDLSSAAAALSPGCHRLTRIEMIALYLPLGSIPAGPQHKPRKKKEQEV